jgi:hypothetical protein
MSCLLSKCYTVFTDLLCLQSFPVPQSQHETRREICQAQKKKKKKRPLTLG